MNIRGWIGGWFAPQAGRTATPAHDALSRYLRQGATDFRPWLDLGCGDGKQAGSLGMDRRALPGVDVVHDIEVLPYPFPDGQFDRVTMSHVMEHIDPAIAVDVVNEVWRVMRVDGVFMLSMPYPGSVGHWQDPTHIRPWNEHTPCYFDPDFPDLYLIYKPKPWKIEARVWRNDGNIEIALRKRAET